MFSYPHLSPHTQHAGFNTPLPAHYQDGDKAKCRSVLELSLHLTLPFLPINIASEGWGGGVHFHTPKGEENKTHEARDMFWRLQGEAHITHAPESVIVMSDEECTRDNALEDTP